MTAFQTKQLKVVPQAGRIGAEIQGVQLSGGFRIKYFK